MTTATPSRSFSGNRLRAARKAAQISQRSAATRLGISRTTLSNAESGLSTPGGDLLGRLADLYGVTIDSLFVHDADATPDSAACAMADSPEPQRASR